MITEEETTNCLPFNFQQIRSYSAGCHLQRTGDTMAPSFLSWAKALSTSLRSSPERVATSPADTGLPALRMVPRTFAVVPVFCRDVPERTVTVNVVGIDVFRLASPEETALPADGTVAEALELFGDEFKSLLPCRCLYVRRHHSSRMISTQRSHFDSGFPSLFIKPWFFEHSSKKRLEVCKSFLTLYENMS